MARNEVSAGQVLGLLHKAERVGAEPSEILIRAAAPFTLADLARGAVPRVHRSHVVAIYRECIVSIGLHSSNLDRKPRMHPDEFRLMCYCLITCQNLREVIKRQIMFFETRGDSISAMALSVEGTTAIITLDTLRKRKTFAGFLSDLAGISIFSRLYAWLLGIGPHPFCATLAYGPSYADETLEDFFVGELIFGGTVNSISFPEKLLALPIVRTPGDLDQLLVEFPFDFMSENPREISLPERVRSIYSKALARDSSVPTLGELAKLIGQSGSTIRRSLADENLSIRSLKDAARRELTIRLLRQGHHTVGDIAGRTGFRDMNSFHTAFRRWTGTSPKRYCQDNP